MPIPVGTQVNQGSYTPQTGVTNVPKKKKAAPQQAVLTAAPLGASTAPPMDVRVQNIFQGYHNVTGRIPDPAKVIDALNSSTGNESVADWQQRFSVLGNENLPQQLRNQAAIGDFTYLGPLNGIPDPTKLGPRITDPNNVPTPDQLLYQNGGQPKTPGLSGWRLLTNNEYLHSWVSGNLSKDPLLAKYPALKPVSDILANSPGTPAGDALAKFFNARGITVSKPPLGQPAYIGPVSAQYANSQDLQTRALTYIFDANVAAALWHSDADANATCSLPEMTSHNIMPSGSDVRTYLYNTYGDDDAVKQAVYDMTFQARPTGLPSFRALYDFTQKCLMTPMNAIKGP